MDRNRDRRLARIERAQAAAGGAPPTLIIMHLGETEEDAIARVCGPAGLPPRGPQDVPHIFVRPVAPPPRDPSSGQVIRTDGEG